MNNNKVKLSIAIPTYNGAKHIRETLDSIVCQLNNINEEIEIVISDNASNDNTPNIIKFYLDKYSYVKYFCNEKNLGADINIDLSISRSNGRYIWLFSDDDIMVYGGLKKVLSVIDDEESLSVIFVNYSIYNYNLTKCFVEKVVHIDKDKICENCDEFLLTTDIASSFISSIIINRSCYLKLDYSEYFNTNWLQFVALLSALPNSCSYCISRPYVIYRSGINRWEKKGKLIEFSYIILPQLIIKICKNKYKLSTIKRILRNRKKNLTSVIVSFKLKNSNIPVKELIHVYKKFPGFWFIDLPLIIIPFIFYKSAFRLYKVKWLNKFFKKIKGKLL